MSEIATIGRYQLENLRANRVGFIFLDLRSEDHRATTAVELQPLLAGAVPVAPDQVLEHLHSINAASNAPIVLICENGSKSMAAAESLEKNSFINVFVVGGGIESL